MYTCCEDIRIILSDSRNNIHYYNVFREYYIQTKRNTVILDIPFCPWCGKQLPSSLREKFFDVLELEYKISTNAGDYKDRPDIPEEFRSDQWWKKRNL
jgi:hypothetical protein